MKKAAAWGRIAKQTVKVILLLVLGGILAVYLPFLYWGFFGYGHCEGCERDAHNSMAKLAFTNTAAYLIKFEARGGDRSDMDGTYWGSLRREEGKDYQLPLSALDGGGESFDHAMKTLWAVNEPRRQAVTMWS